MTVVVTRSFRLADAGDAGVVARLVAAGEGEAARRAGVPGFVTAALRTTLAADGQVEVREEWDSASAHDGFVAGGGAAPEAAYVPLAEGGQVTTRVSTLLDVAGEGRRHARALYLEGIRDGRAREAVTAHTGRRYTQHSTGVADGIEGFVTFFEPFVAAHPGREIRLVRSFADGRFVFVHAHQSLDDGAAEWVTTDLFETDGDGRVVEHWDVIAPYLGVLPAGLTQVDGPVEVTDHLATEANKARVVALFDRGPEPEVLEGDHRVPEPDPGPLADRTLHRVVGQGCFVATLSAAVVDGRPWAVVDLLRLEGGRVVERWDNREPVPADDVNGGKF